jgi:ketopantoate hydroxymethyltransferase
MLESYHWKQSSNQSKQTNDMITLTDTFNKKVISHHRTVAAAVRAEAKHNRAVKKANGQNSYVWYAITSSDGSYIQEEVLIEQAKLDRGY